MDSNLQNKLQQFSAPLPPGVWDKIADALDANDDFAQRLYHYEAQPPSGVWQKIEQNLEEVTPAKVVPLTSRFKKPLRYIAAASILVVVLVTITLSVKRTEAGALEAGTPTTPHSNSTTVVRNDEPGKKIVSPTDEAFQKAPSNQKKNTGDTEVVSPEKSDRFIATTGNSHKQVRTKAVYSSLNNYVMFSDGDGKLRRVSKKLANLVKCKDGDGACQQRLQQLRQKMAAKAMTTDFTGILEMLHQLQ
jgi:hypothetical protein